jgi:DNA-binding GntR family transcriptional regulator
MEVLRERELITTIHGRGTFVAQGNTRRPTGERR